MEHVKVTRDVITETAKTLNVDYRLIEKQYYYWIENLLKLKSDHKNVAIKIEHLGTLFLGLKGANAYKHFYEKRDEPEKKEFAEKQIKEIEERIAINRERGVKKQPFFKKRPKAKKPLNF